MTTFTHQLNAYYGVHYDSEYIDVVLAVAKNSAKFRGLASDDAEQTVGKCHLFASTNSDESDGAARGLIFVDEMTFGGPDEENSTDTFVNIEPNEMEKREKKYRPAVDAVTDLYDLIIKEFKLKKLPLNKVYLGWSVVSCTWDLSDSESSDDEEKQKSPKAKSPKVETPEVELPIKKRAAKKQTADKSGKK